VQDFTNTVQNGALAGIGTLSNDIYNDVAKDPGGQERHAGLGCLHGPQRLHLPPAGDRVLPGTAGHLRQAGRGKARAYTRELSKLPDLLKTASAQPFTSGQPGRSTAPAGQPTSSGG
jgi:hypothetical protein